MAGAIAPTPSGPTAESERILLLECRLEKFCSALDEARADADVLRGRLAESAAREADHARRYSLAHQELAEARAEIASLHERLSRSEALRAELEGHLFEAGARGDAAELVRLRRELLSQRERFLAGEQTTARLRARVDELLLSRETLLSRVAEWQHLVQKDEPGAVDLAEFIAELRRDIMLLEQRNAAGERQEAVLRERLIRAGVDPQTPVEEDSASGVAAAPTLTMRATTNTDRTKPAATVRRPTARDSFENSLSSAGEPGIVQPPAEAMAPVPAGDRRPDNPLDADSPTSAHPPERVEITIVPPEIAPAAEPKASSARVTPGPIEELSAADPAVRAAAYERLIRDFGGKPSVLADYLRAGLADPDPRVRRRTVLAAATARRLSLRPLLDPLRADPDPQVRRVVREVLRYAQESESYEPDAEGITGNPIDRIRAVQPNRSHFPE